ncbi:FtsW/RodA/SpoVE family cell cycle protein [Micrococcoides hystricis]|uniref:FtsW/RodA/SpoVE family cell cycle protein n=1 Tax=Micrococcoides hystricis TaxID=1572761 RepID=A0ABV6PCA6_9MICC
MTAQATPAKKTPTKRNLELWLLFIGLVIAIGADFLTTISMKEEMDTAFYLQSIVLVAVALMLHIVVRSRLPYADPYLLPIVVTLNGLGITMIHRLDLVSGDSAATRQLLWTTVAALICAALIIAVRDYRLLDRYTYLFLVISAVLLVLPLIPGLGREEYGAKIWINLGFATFQPGEIAKITLAIFFASYLAANRHLILLAGKKVGKIQLPRFRDMAPIMIAWLISIGVLVMQRDLGSSILFFGLFLAMLYVATNRFSWIAIGLVLVAIGGVFAAQTMSHVQLRIEAWLNAFDPEVYNRMYGASHQVVQGLFGLASGGLSGTGLGAGRPDLISVANSDMIIAAFGEELGFIGLTAIIMLYVLFVTRAMRTALSVGADFGKLLAAGLGAVIALQCFVVIGGVTRLIPLTGLTTPFLAAGGSSLLANWIIVALLLMISHAGRRPVKAGLAPSTETAAQREVTASGVK